MTNETLEQAAEKYANKDQHTRSSIDFIEGVKWQAEQAKNLNITLEDYDSTCADGCCYDYGTITTVNGVELECHNTDTESILRQILEHLGYKVTIEYK